MRSKMLGLAVALMTFGLGVTATTAWIAYQIPNVPAPAHALAAETSEGGRVTLAPTQDSTTPCRWSSPQSVIAIGGNLNSRGVVTPMPAYPPLARAARASGTVVVQVLADECGNVISARASSGHPLLQQAAVQAAYGWHFPPTHSGGKTSKVKGALTFNFLLQ